MRQRRFLLFSLLLWLTTTLIVARQAQANVTLISFNASASEDGIVLEWETATELESGGFMIKRAITPDGFLPLTNDGDVIAIAYNGENTTFVPAAGLSGAGANYLALDANVVNGVTYWYRLVEVELNQNRLDLQTKSATAGELPTPTPTPQGFNLPATGTPLVTSAATASATPLNNSTPIPLPPTPQPTGSVPTATPLSAATQTPTRLNAVATPTNPTNPSPTANLPTATLTVVQPVAEATQPPIGSGIVEAAQAYPVSTAVGTEAPYVGPTPIEPQSLATVEAPTDPQSAPQITSVAPSATAQPLPPPRDAADTGNTRSRVILWGGFIAALLIFVAGVIGSVIVFTRRQNRSS